MKPDRIQLFKSKEKCCGCGACMNICSNSAITMQNDEYGFLYPTIDYEKCIYCNMCKKVCGYQKEEGLMYPIKTYAAMATDNEILLKSASGGVFAALAKEVINMGGAVFGCSMEFTNGSITPEHIKVEIQDELIKLQGSKYVQSYIGNTYQQVEYELKASRVVLFSGTPCQVEGLKCFLGKEYGNLLTIDIVCHGVPSAAFFRSYIELLEKKVRGKIISFKFRDKTNGWGLEASMEYKTNRNILKKKMIPVKLSSYYKLFLDSDTYRENCYSCKYAGENRIGDLTVGDYWGVEKEHPNYLVANGGEMNAKKGISCVLVNTEHGRKMLEKMRGGLQLKVSSFEKAAKQNDQLQRPSNRSKKREMILNMYKYEGYTAIESWYSKQLGIKRYIYGVWNMIPKKIQNVLKKIL